MQKKTWFSIIVCAVVAALLAGCGAVNEENKKPGNGTGVESSESKLTEDGSSEESGTETENSSEPESGSEAEKDSAQESSSQEVSDADKYMADGLAFLYPTTNGVVQLEAARRNFEEARNLGCIDANFYLGILTYLYHYPQQDNDTAKAYFEACPDNAYAQIYLGMMYLEGDAVEKDEEKALQIFDDYVAKGYAEAYYGKACYAEEQKDSAAVEYCREAIKSAEQIFKSSAYNKMGYLLHDADFIENDLAAAVNYYETAISLGNVNAYNNLGYMYHHGQAVEQDYAKALELYKKGVALGSDAAANQIGWMYSYGHGVEQNYEEALVWYQRGAELGNGNCVNNLGYAYEMGWGVAADCVKALEYYIQAGELGNGYGWGNAGNIYLHGREGVEVNVEKALECYKKGAELDHLVSINQVGYIYGDLYGDFEEGLTWYLKAADAGLPVAMANIGYYYLYGLGTETDLAMAETYFTMAKDAGYEDYQACFDELAQWKYMLEGSENEY